MSVLLGWWKGEDNLVDTANGFNGVCPDPRVMVYTTGYIGRCFRLTWPDDEFGPLGFRVPFHSELNFSGADKFFLEFYLGQAFWDEEHTYSTVFKIAMTPSVFTSYINFDVDGNPGSESLKIVVGIVDEGEITQQYNLTPYSLSSWAKWKITYDNGLWEFYINDIKQTPVAYRTAVIPENDYAWYFFGFGTYYNISVDEIKIYNDSGLGKKTVRFSDTSRGLIASTDLDFGDGSTHATELPVDHEYDLDAIGEPYTVDATLIATDTKGNSDTITKTVSLV
jgi:hypothetical protein